MGKINFVATIFFICLSLNADETVVKDMQQDNNCTAFELPQKHQETKGIPQKVKAFFNGIIDDFQEFGTDNNLIDSKK